MDNISIFEVVVQWQIILATIVEKPTGTFRSCPKCLVANTKNKKMTIPNFATKITISFWEIVLFFFLETRVRDKTIANQYKIIFTEDIHLERAKVQHLLSSNLNLWFLLLVSPLHGKFSELFRKFKFDLDQSSFLKGNNL
ncbi:hypothetical protein AQUCO_06300051v1 [Aquilegia coerulea]|uniref:Uncharacterized protein n=1 Tax=Aquilegia coerulea TaxID=218851 RepID=A0A2G5CCU0_AQUCA|nr:hypothetical protein AQUCO_06300051v1 [Aquilegia coerulea]PIA29096.1 hypothetical protein AQUCO_06300051v1 [Aquilegia coerulea]PIA29097.1 hypothetical protein AQUCO_06300051v1 [Aquilegia coerulea]PIA29098.1 hypothetical protein AQUCO_06300051v1 [Aquilegia coerulea]PIA29099.1 hypothetical protein AQUCO_06300051v1 [Aquilegia coerulea]